MKYHSLTQEEQDLAIAQELHSRELEHFHYSLYVTKYQAMLAEPELADLPEEWPKELLEHKGKTRDQVAAQASDSTQALLLQYRDRLRQLIVTEQHECDNVERIHKVLSAQLPDERKDTAFAAAKVVRENS